MKVMWIVVVVVLAVVLGAGFWLWTPDKSRSELEAKYLRSPSDMVRVAVTMLHVRDDGADGAPALIMIHGFGSSLHTWEAWAQALKDNYRVIRIDLPGSGLSPPDPIGIYTDERTIDVILALMDRMGLQKASFVGNSIGGRIAWTFAARQPERVESLILVSPDGFASAGFAYGEKPDIPASLRLMRYVLPKWLLRSTLEQSYGDPSRLTEDTIDRYYDLMLAPGSRPALIARLEQTVLVPPEPLLRTIQKPVLLLWGEKDALIPVENARDYLDVLPDAQLVTFPELGHVPHEEAPARTIVPVQTFLEKVDTGGGAR